MHSSGSKQVQYICLICTSTCQSWPRSVSNQTYPSYSIVLMMKPSVGLTLFTSSFMILFTMVVFPALSSPLGNQSFGAQTFHKYPQHQYPHLLVLQTCFPQDREHLDATRSWLFCVVRALCLNVSWCGTLRSSAKLANAVAAPKLSRLRRTTRCTFRSIVLRTSIAAKPPTKSTVVVLDHVAEAVIETFKYTSGDRDAGLWLELQKKNLSLPSPITLRRWQARCYHPH